MVETQLCKLRGTSDTFTSWFLWTKRTILLMLSFTQNIIRACFIFYPYEGYRSVTPLDAARVNRTILLMLSFTQNIIRACFMFYPYEGYRSVTPLDAARVNRTIFHNHSVH